MFVNFLMLSNSGSCPGRPYRKRCFVITDSTRSQVLSNIFVTSHCTHLSSGTRKSSRVLGGACCSALPRRRPLSQAKHPNTVRGEIPEGLPGVPVVLGALQHHGGGAGGAEHQDEVCEEELRLQVELERLVPHPLRGLPPGVRVAERGVAHCRGRVRLAGDSRVALAALRSRAGLPDAGGGSLSVEAEELRGVGAADRAGAQHSALGQVAHSGVAGSAGAAGSWTFGFRRLW